MVYCIRWEVLASTLVGCILLAIVVVQMRIDVAENSRSAVLGPTLCAAAPPNISEASQDILIGLEFIAHEDVKKLTRNFDKSMKLGHGRFGAIYQGTTSDGRKVAVRQLDIRIARIMNITQFKREVWKLSTMHHRNILPLLGYYLEESFPERFPWLMYPLHRSLADELHSLSWQERYKVAVDVGEGLAYLHEGARLLVGNGHMKLENILFSRTAQDFTAFIADAGLEDLMSNFSEFNGLNLSPEADVLRFGRLLATLVSGQKLVDKEDVDRARKHDLKLIVDTNLQTHFDEKQVELMLSVASQCMEDDPDARPRISDALSMLKGCLNGLSHGAAHQSFITFEHNTLTLQVYYVNEMIPLLVLALVAVGITILYNWRNYRQWRSRKPLPSVSNYTQVEDADDYGSNLSPTSRWLHDCVLYKYRELEQAADGFSKETGRGTFGIVFEGTLAHRKVAIKRMQILHSTMTSNFEEEIRRISMVRHKNVIQLLGYSIRESGEDLNLLMVTPLHSSLAKYLEEPPPNMWLNWEARFKIALGVAKGLAYLHDGAPQRQIHHDIKPGNILFDSNTFEAYIADFGTAKLMPWTEEEVGTTTFTGTRGYADPHFKMYLRRTVKVDVYSFGVLLFVLVGGPHSKDVPGFVKDAIMCDVIDPAFKNDRTYNGEEVDRMLAIARQCTEFEPEKRPTMSRVVMMLNGDIAYWPIAQDISSLASSAATYTRSSFSKVKRYTSNIFSDERHLWPGSGRTAQQL